MAAGWPQKALTSQGCRTSLESSLGAGARGLRRESGCTGSAPEVEAESSPWLGSLRGGARSVWLPCTGRGPLAAGPAAQSPLTAGVLLRVLQARLWVQLMRELRHGVKLKKVEEKQFNPLPTEYQLTPFEMLMQDIRARNYKLRKVMVSEGRGRGCSDGPPLHCSPTGLSLWASPNSSLPGPLQVDGDIPPRVKKDAHELILDFIRSRPPLRQVSPVPGSPLLQGGASQVQVGPGGCLLEKLGEGGREASWVQGERDSPSGGGLPCPALQERPRCMQSRSPVSHPHAESHANIDTARP